MRSSEQTDKEEFSVAMTAKLHRQASGHLLREDGQEDVCFALYKPSYGHSRFTALIHEILFPGPDERKVHGNATINPQFIKRVCHLASENSSGLALMHSHPVEGWQGMSLDDFSTERKFSIPASITSELPFIGLTIGTDGAWSGRMWDNVNGWEERKWARNVRVVGRELSVTHNDLLLPKPTFKEIYKRTITVWGEENHAKLARLRIGIVGLGSVGSLVAESLARMGIERFVLIDFDEVQEHNLDRLLGATLNDVGQLKASIAQRQILRASTATNPQTKVVFHGITEEAGYRSALDCDVIFSCVDRPWPRHVLNHIAYNHLIPVIDGGIIVRLEPDSGIFLGAEWQAQSVGPERPCLQCLNMYSPADVSTEREGLLENSSYLAGLPHDHSFKRNENIFPFSSSLASLEVLQLIEQVTGIGSSHYFGIQRYAYNQGYIRVCDDKTCALGCLFSEAEATGDSIIPAPTGVDHSAIIARTRQE